MGVYDRPLPDLEEVIVIDRLREQIQQRLDQLTGEADRLRKALAALDPRASKAPARKPPARKPPAPKAAQATATKPAASGTKRTPARRTRPSATPSRSPDRARRDQGQPCWPRSLAARR